jgi:DNA polymerase I-like protein with 3'-5' exonuclease and polymerase domains
LTLFPDFARLDRVALDTETDGLGFKNRPVGLSWATPDGRSGYLAWGHAEDTVGSIFDDVAAPANNCSLAEVREWAARELRSDLLTVYHNAPFDLRMLAYVGIRPPSLVEDTQVAAPVLNEMEPAFSLNALGKKYAGREKSDDALNEWCAAAFGGKATREGQGGNYWRAPAHVVAPYARGDAELTLALYDALRPRIASEGLEAVYALETAIVPIVVEMHLTGVRVDVDGAVALDKQLTARIDALRSTWDGIAPGADPGKTKQIVPVFERFGLPVARTEKGAASIVVEDLAHIPHVAAQTLLEWRKLTKFRDTFVRTYILENADETGVVHPEFHSLRSDDFGSVAGRFSSGSSDGSLNVQNIPGRDDTWAPIIRGLFVPYHQGWNWLKADYSQLQFRLLAHYAALLGYPELARAYRDDPTVDFHQLCADLTGVPRKVAKNINFGLVFGMGKKKLARTLGVSEEEAERLIAQYHRKLPAVRATYDALADRVNEKGQIKTLGGRIRRFRSAEEARAMNWTVRDDERYVGCHKGLNALLQGGEGDMMKRAMVELRPVCHEFGIPLHMTVHDELALSIPQGDHGNRFTTRVKEVMEDHRLEVPIRVDLAVGPNWGSTEALPLKAAA